LHAGWLPEVDRLVIATFVEGSEGVNGSVWDQLSAEEWFPTEGLDGNAQPQGGFVQLLDDAVRGLDMRLKGAGDGAAMARRRRRGDAQERRADEADRAVVTIPIGLLRDGRFRLDPLPPVEQRRRSDGWATARACWPRSTCAFRTSSGREVEMVRPPARCAGPARHVQHLRLAHRGDRPADPPELCQRPHRRAATSASWATKR
jgi:hypothetical protein